MLLRQQPANACPGSRGSRTYDVGIDCFVNRSQRQTSYRCSLRRGVSVHALILFHTEKNYLTRGCYKSGGDMVGVIDCKTAAGVFTDSNFTILVSSRN